MTHIVDQEEARRLLRVVAPANVLLLGPPGSGKTTIARGYLSEFGELLEIGGSRVRAYLSKIKRHRGPVLIDEAHKILTPEDLYPLLDTGLIHHPFHGPGVPKTFAFTTTDEGRLPGPLLSRLVPVVLRPYETKHLAEIAGLVDPRLTGPVTTEIAKYSWGSPRKAKILASLLSRAGVRRPTQVKPTLAAVGYPLGLSYRQIALLESLLLKPRSLATLAGMLGTSTTTIKAIESDLLRCGLVGITSKGRELTEIGALVLESLDKS